MTIYEIDRSIEDLIAKSIDPETGELILDAEALEALQMERDRKVENLALYIKNEQVFSAALKAEQENLKKRQEIVDNRVDRLKAFLMQVYADKKFQTERVVCKFTDSVQTKVDPEFIDWAKANRPELVPAKPVTYQPDKKAIKAALEAGEALEYASLVPARSVTVK